VQSITMNSDGRVTVPAALRRELRLRPGQRFLPVSSDGVLLLVPVRAAAELRGFLAGIDVSIPRDPERT
jgi:bifunctional DNA-binding transcriptional regulator/antitoxin component of YhaV-PrlF toxin-antitoxin module